MNYLVDTHILIWHIEGNKRLSKKQISTLENPKNKIFISNAVLWEIAIKTSIGKLSMSIEFRSLEKFLRENGFELLGYDYSDLAILITLPFHHQDPFDRLIISQSISKQFDIITDDEKFKKYPVPLLM